MKPLAIHVGYAYLAETPDGKLQNVTYTGLENSNHHVKRVNATIDEVATLHRNENNEPLFKLLIN